MMSGSQMLISLHGVSLDDVKSTVEDYLNNIGPTTKIILLKDLTSSVPGFHHLGYELEKTLIDKGHFVTTSDNLNTLLMKLEMRY